MDSILFIFAGLVIGGLLVYLVLSRRGQQTKVTVHSSTLLEKVEKVFKIVLVEGHFSEIYDYQPINRSQNISQEVKNINYESLTLDTSAHN